MKKSIFILIISFVAMFSAFATKVSVDQFNVGTFDSISNTYYLRNVEVFYDDETGLMGFSYNRGQSNDVRYTYNFVSQGDIDSFMKDIQNCLAIMKGTKKVGELNKINELSTSKSQNYEFSVKIDLERDEIIEVGSVSSIERTYSSFKMTCFLQQNSKNLCLGGDKVTFVPGNKKTNTEVFGLNEIVLERFLRALRKENIDVLQRGYYEKVYSSER